MKAKDFVDYLLEKLPEFPIEDVKHYEYVPRREVADTGITCHRCGQDAAVCWCPMRTWDE